MAAELADEALNGSGQAKQSQGMRASFGSRSPIRVTAAVQDHARARDPPVHGLISTPWDNAAMESLMGIVKSECARAYATREEAVLDLIERIEVVYNRARSHSALGYLGPAEFEEANWPKGNSRSKAA